MRVETDGSRGAGAPIQLRRQLLGKDAGFIRVVFDEFQPAKRSDHDERAGSGALDQGLLGDPGVALAVVGADVARLARRIPELAPQVVDQEIDAAIRSHCIEPGDGIQEVFAPVHAFRVTH